MRKLDDRRWLIASFVILVSVVVFLSWDVNRKLDRNLETTCTVAWATVSSSEAVSSLLLVTSNLEGLPKEEQETVVELAEFQAAILDEMVRLCGLPPDTLTAQ